MLKLSRDRKVTPLAKHSKAGWRPEISNAFGLPAHISCPGKTSVCETICYAFKLEKAYTNVSKLLKHNWDELQKCNDDVHTMAMLLHELVEEYKKEHERIEKLRDTTLPKVFRIHWDGDFFSENYARAWRQVMNHHTDVRFWAYTRSINEGCNVIPHLYQASNLSLYISVDDANQERAQDLLNQYPTVKGAFLAQDFDTAQQVSVVSISKRSPKCPEQTGRYELITNSRGACVECMLCVNGVNDVLFSISKK